MLEAPVAGAIVGRVRAVALPFSRVAPQMNRVAVFPSFLAERVRHDAGRGRLPREQVRLVVAVTGSGRSAPLRLLANGKVLLEDSAF